MYCTFFVLVIMHKKESIPSKIFFGSIKFNLIKQHTVVWEIFVGDNLVVEFIHVVKLY